MYARDVRTLFAFLVVLSHIGLIGFCAVYFQTVITKPEIYLTAIAIFLPLFGTYVGIVVGNLKMAIGGRGGRVSWTFTIMMLIFWLAYLCGVLFVIYSYDTGFIRNEDMFVACLAVVETAFGGFFTSLFLTLFGLGDWSGA
jgi:hypothetical protein